jgi:uncharacterized membrane protein
VFGLEMVVLLGVALVVCGAFARRTLCPPARRAAVRDYVRVLLDDVQRDVAQPADRDPLLERGNRLIKGLSA